MNKVSTYIKEKVNNLNEFGHTIRCHDNYNQWLPPRTFYRGESRVYGKTSNVAGVFRSNYQESSLYHNYMSRFPNTFKNMTNYAKLTYMQHFGLPTCLLDITSNFLVALYFASCHIYHDNKGNAKENPNLDGVVWMILPKVTSLNKENKSLYYKIYNTYSDIINILSTLALFKTPCQHDIFKKIHEFTDKYPFRERQSLFQNIIHGNGKILRHKNYKIMKNFFDNLTDCYSFQRLFHKIQQTDRGFKPDLDPNHMFKPRIVQPAITNQRIKAQRGYFIIENYRSNNRRKNKLKLLKKDKNISKDIKNHFTLIPIRIPNINKATILQDLDINYGINKARLFPDYENVAQYMKEEFKYL